MKLGKTALAALVLAALGAYLWFVEREAIREEAETARLLELETEDVNEVRLTYPDREILLRKSGAGWRIEAPLSTEADETAVDNLVRAIVDAELKKTLEEPESDATYGLDPPSVIATLVDASDETVVVRVGKTSPVGFSTYVAVEGREGVALVPSAVHSGMQKTVTELRDKTILAFDDTAVRAVAIEASHDADSVRLARLDDGAWGIVEPRELDADADEVRGFFATLRGLRAQDFLDDPGSLADLGLEEPARRIVLETEGESLELLIGVEVERDDSKELYVKRADRDVVYTIGTWSGRGLDKTSMDFRDKTLLAFEREQVGRVEATRADGSGFVLTRIGAGDASDDTSWTLADLGEDERLHRHRLVQLVGDLTGLEGFEVVEEEPADLSVYGLDDPTVRYRVLGADDQELGSVALTRDEDDAEESAFATSSRSPMVLRVRGYLMTHLDKARTDFLDLDEPEAAAPVASEAGDSGGAPSASGLADAERPDAEAASVAP